MKKRDHVIAKVKARFLQNPPKFGVEVPTSVEEAYKLNKKITTLFGVTRSRNKLSMFILLSIYWITVIKNL